MKKELLVGSLAALAISLSGNAAQAQRNCTSPPLEFNSHVAEIEGQATVKSGKGCGFNVNGIDGTINETVIVRKPKVGTAGIDGKTAYYIAKAGYQGPDEFTYAYIGTDQYGGPMRVTIKRRITVVP
jgi:hypothetical protein